MYSIYETVLIYMLFKASSVTLRKESKFSKNKRESQANPLTFSRESWVKYWSNFSEILSDPVHRLIPKFRCLSIIQAMCCRGFNLSFIIIWTGLMSCCNQDIVQSSLSTLLSSRTKGHNWSDPHPLNTQILWFDIFFKFEVRQTFEVVKICGKP